MDNAVGSNLDPGSIIEAVARQPSPGPAATIVLTRRDRDASSFTFLPVKRHHDEVERSIRRHGYINFGFAHGPIRLRSNIDRLPRTATIGTAPQNRFFRTVARDPETGAPLNDHWLAREPAEVVRGWQSDKGESRVDNRAAIRTRCTGRHGNHRGYYEYSLKLGHDPRLHPLVIIQRLFQE
jgi:hypothetical protein